MCVWGGGGGWNEGFRFVKALRNILYKQMPVKKNSNSIRLILLIYFKICTELLD